MHYAAMSIAIAILIFLLMILLVGNWSNRGSMFYSGVNQSLVAFEID